MHRTLDVGIATLRALGMIVGNLGSLFESHVLAPFEHLRQPRHALLVKFFLRSRRSEIGNKGHFLNRMHLVPMQCAHFTRKPFPNVLQGQCQSCTRCKAIEIILKDNDGHVLSRIDKLLKSKGRVLNFMDLKKEFQKQPRTEIGSQAILANDDSKGAVGCFEIAKEVNLIGRPFEQVKSYDALAFGERAGIKEDTAKSLDSLHVLTAQFRIGNHEKAAHGQAQSERKDLLQIGIQVLKIRCLGLPQYRGIDNVSRRCEKSLDEPGQAQNDLQSPGTALVKDNPKVSVHQQTQCRESMKELNVHFVCRHFFYGCTLTVISGLSCAKQSIKKDHDRSAVKKTFFDLYAMRKESVSFSHKDMYSFVSIEEKKLWVARNWPLRLNLTMC